MKKYISTRILFAILSVFCHVCAADQINDKPEISSPLRIEIILPKPHSCHCTPPHDEDEQYEHPVNVNIELRDFNTSSAHLAALKKTLDYGKSEFVSPITAVNFMGSKIGDAGAMILAECNLTDLRILNLQDNDITDIGGAALLKSKNFHHLEYVDLSGNKISKEMSLALKKAWFPDT